MIHVYLSMPSGNLTGHRLVDEIIALNARVGLVQAASGDDETTRQIAAAHIAACEGLLAVIAGAPTQSQTWEITSATEAGIPILLLSDNPTADIVEGQAVQTFNPETFHAFVDTITPRQ